ncbi:hypothetical protein Ddye_017723 [Dipteronia dyeriana]|uniref:RRM domain-containing protein n=1 Tax=Dipteronia dyeriana TaxID=168575 RepID=A0AAD9X025_9ROSI|nr:hypothetical protein Ddye_017723 [Dipteronia dyeriana]
MDIPLFSGYSAVNLVTVDTLLVCGVSSSHLEEFRTSCNRRSNYAFIRFDSSEKTVKVTNLVDGMHVTDGQLVQRSRITGGITEAQVINSSCGALNEKWKMKSKLSSFDNGVIRSLGGSLLSREIGVDAVGSAGGLITMWNENLFSIKACVSYNICIIVVGELLRINKEVVFCNVCAANVENKRKKLWDFILNFQAMFIVLWCIGRDFNSVRDSSERKWGVCNMASIHNFNYFISKAQVVDLPLRGLTFTWTNHRERASWARLDRFLISLLILLWFSNLIQNGLSYSISDDNAILIEVAKED